MPVIITSKNIPIIGLNFALTLFLLHSNVLSLSGYCSLTYPNFTDGNVKYIREGFEKRVGYCNAKLTNVDNVNLSCMTRTPPRVAAGYVAVMRDPN